MSEPLTIAAAAPLIRSGELTPSELLEQCLRRIDLYEPAVQAWVYLDRERARRDAARLTDEAKAGRGRGPLHGVPVGVKDIIDVFDMPTGCGSKRWANSYARRDATVVERLRQAGAVILGKTVTTPYAYLDPPPTRNPWDLTRTPGGSSSGSAAAVACGMCLAALGTQTGGSLTRPASFCGVCSLKPTLQWCWDDGVLPLAPKLDHIGIMANCVRDLFTVYRATVRGRIEHEDEYRVRPDRDWSDHALTDRESGPGLTPFRFYVTEDLGLKQCDQAVSSVMSGLYRQVAGDVPGAELWTADLPAWFIDVWRHHRLVMAVGAAQTHADRINRLPDDYPQRITELIREGQQASAVEYANAADLCRYNWDRSLEVSNCFLDGVLLWPAAPSLPPYRDTTGDAAMNSPWSFFGYPTVSVPVGWTTGGLPVAAQVIGPGRFKEVRTLAAATLLETAVSHQSRLPPVPA